MVIKEDLVCMACGSRYVKPVFYSDRYVYDMQSTCLECGSKQEFQSRAFNYLRWWEWEREIDIILRTVKFSDWLKEK